jgi:hypothetical protein
MAQFLQLTSRTNLLMAKIMDDHKDDDGYQQRDRLLLRLLKTPPKPRPKRDRGREKPTTRTRAKRASAGKPAPSA